VNSELDVQKRSRIGVVLNCESIQNWAYEVLQEVIKKDCLCWLIVTPARKSEHVKYNSKAYSWLLQFDSSRYQSSIAMDALKEIPVKDFSEICAVVYSCQCMDNGILILDESVKSAIGMSCIDLVLNLSSYYLPADRELESVEYGVWASYIGNFQPIAFEEILENRKTLEAGWKMEIRGRQYVYCSDGFLRRDSIYLTKNLAYWKLVAMVKRCLNYLRDADFTIFSVLVEATEVSRLPPVQLTPLRGLEYVFRWFLFKLKKRILEQFFKEQWFIAVRKLGECAEVSGKGEKYQVLKNNRGSGWADPFLFEWVGDSYIFFEEIRSETGVGVISCAKLVGAELKEPQVVLDTGYHLSYPFVFSYENEVYMIPESSANRTIDLYRAHQFPNEWVLENTIMQNITAVDTTMFYHDNIYWIFTTIAPKGGDTYSELHLFYANSPFGPWVPHKKNPVVSDIRRARSAGSLFFNHAGILIRPGQDCSVRYGYGITLNAIDTLTNEEYKEYEIGYIDSGWMWNSLATHTINFNESIEVVDVNRRVLRSIRQICNVHHG
jgi:hypothetical protein